MNSLLSYSRGQAYPWLTRAKIERAKQSTLADQLQTTAKRFLFRGANAEIQHYERGEILLCGAAGTGKTLAVLYRLNELAWQYPKSRWLLVRKVRADLAQSVLVTFESEILGEESQICSGARRENRLSYRYPNGSEIVLGGMDRPGRILSAEFDGAYLSEAVQFSQDDFEIISSRLRHTATPNKIILMDTNPDRPDHWLKIAADEGRITMLNSYHTDNPSLHDGADWTQRGRDYLARLSNLTGVRRERYFNNRWAIAEGAIYDMWDERIHIVDSVPPFVRRFRAIDFGYTNPFTCQWWGVDHDGRMYLYREIYHTGRLVEDWARQIAELSQGETIESTVADHDAEDRATLARHGIATIAAKKEVSPGIQSVQSRLRVQDDGKPRLFYVRGALIERDYSLKSAGKPASFVDEIGGYVWNDNSRREQPVKMDDHAMDCTRYAVMYLDASATHATKLDLKLFGG